RAGLDVVAGHRRRARDDQLGILLPEAVQQEGRGVAGALGHALRLPHGPPGPLVERDEDGGPWVRDAGGEIVLVHVVGEDELVPIKDWRGPGAVLAVEGPQVLAP